MDITMNDYFGKNADALREKKLFLFDMDGTVYLENTLFDGVKKLLGDIVTAGGTYVFITNNSSKSVDDYVQKMQTLGVSVTEDNFFTSTQAAVTILKETAGDGLIYAQGTGSFIAELRGGGLSVTEGYDETAQAILVGFDTELTGEKMRTTCKMLSKCDVPYYATNPDWVCPVDFGYVPDCGSMCFGYEKATGRKPRFIGKPEPLMIECAMRKFGVSRAQTAVLGDRLYTDIASGVNAGVDTVCVLSGEVTLSDIRESDIKPTYVFRGVWDITL